MMRSIWITMFVATVAFTFSTSTFAAEKKQASAAEKKADKCPRTTERCIQNGIRMGNSSSDASTWCSRNNNGCPR